MKYTYKELNYISLALDMLIPSYAEYPDKLKELEDLADKVVKHQSSEIEEEDEQ